MPADHRTPDPYPVPTSPTGRIPQWVLDEAVGRPVEPVPFRAWAPGPPQLPPRGPRRVLRRLLRGVLALLLVAAFAAGVLHLGGDLPLPGAVPAAGGAPRQGPPAGSEESGSPLGQPPPVPAVPEGSTMRFSQHQDGTGVPVTWSPCRPIHLVTRPDDEPAGGADLVRQAVAEVSGATGLRFVDDGPTDEAPAADRSPYQPDRYGDRWAPVLVAWATPEEVPDLAGEVAGMAGPVAVTPPSGGPAYVSGVLYLDAPDMTRILATQGTAAARVVVMHELGHLVGLGHVDAPDQVMFTSTTGQVTGFGAGDRAGLAALGRGPCRPDV